MTYRYYVERVAGAEGWDIELRDRLQGTNAEPMGYFRDFSTADEIAALLNTCQVEPGKATPALARAAQRVLENA